jgi:Outer membrane protein beta-barrel domain
MRKQLLLAFSGLMITGVALAQVSIGVHTGGNLSTATVKAGSNTSKGKLLAGFHAGVTADVALTPELHALPMLRFIQKGNKIKEEQTFSSGLGSTTNKSDVTTTLNYIELPLNIVYNFDLGESATFFAGTGPAFSYALSGKTKGTNTTSITIGTQTTSNSTSIDQKTKIGSNQSDDIKDFDFGWNGVAGVKLNNGFALMLNYTHSLSNLSPKDNTSYKGRSFGLSLNYFFNSDNEK